MTAAVAPTISALQRRGDEVVAHLLRENESRWDSLSHGDRERLEALAHEVAVRLLQEPARRLDNARGQRSFQYARQLRELFGLDVDDLHGAASQLAC
jgi:glutamyl-tRNA reductase